MNILAHKTVFLQTDNDVFAEVESIKTQPTIKLPDDPIALGCASYRLGLAGQGQYHDFDHLSVMPEDRNMALDIRNYYRAKITWQMLKNTDAQKPISEFRRKLMGIIENNHDITQKDLGILYRIPYFYAEDCEHDAIFAELPEYRIVEVPGKDIETTVTLNRRVEVMRRTRNVTQYWFNTEKTIVPLMISVDSQNTLKPLFDSIVRRGPVKLRANWVPKTMFNSQDRNRHYYQLTQVKLA